MADKKISELTELTTVDDTDLLAVVDITANETKKVTKENLLKEIESIQVGFILLWNGLIAAIPTGFQLCDGSNGTPDLRDKFVVGATADDVGVAKTCVTGVYTQSGGAITHIHTGSISVTAHAAHTHAFGTIAVANHASHTHSAGTLAVSLGYASCCICVESYVSCSAWPAGYYHVHTATVSGSIGNETATLTHSVSGSTGNPSATLTHSGSVTINTCPTLPPYFALAYIQKI
jgi:hypothetical protein